MSGTIPPFPHMKMLCTGATLHNVGQNFIQNNCREYNDVLRSFTGTDFN